MRTIVQPIQPQPVLVDDGKVRRWKRWIWGPEEPITDMCTTPPGNAWVSWCEVDDTIATDAMASHCPIERPAKARVEVSHDGERWLWIVRVPEKRGRK